MFSNVNNDGNQWSTGRLSLDFFCKTCRIGVNVSGLFKFICPTHKVILTNSRIFDSQKVLHKRTQFKKNLVLNCGYVDEIIEIGSCCIQKNDYPTELKRNTFLYSENMGQKVKENILQFEKDKYTKINWQDGIQSAFTVNLNNSPYPIDASYTITKFDINFAYIQSLFKKDILLPFGNKKCLVFEEANTEFYKLMGRQDIFGIVKFKISYPDNLLPFFPSRTKWGMRYSVCRQCLSGKKHKNDNNKIIFTCEHNHGFHQRAFIQTSYLSDLYWYIEKIQLDKSNIEILNIEYYNAVKSQKLMEFGKQIYNMKKFETNLFEKTFLKASLLGGLGRFALNLTQENGRTRQIESVDEICNI